MLVICIVMLILTFKKSDKKFARISGLISLAIYLPLLVIRAISLTIATCSFYNKQEEGRKCAQTGANIKIVLIFNELKNIIYMGDINEF
ncbi:MAG: hypothetical protein M0R05_07000 [Bacilli bacterium]|nr:hypothetical protein [Bacilli bacterium]